MDSTYLNWSNTFLGFCNTMIQISRFSGHLKSIRENRLILLKNLNDQTSFDRLLNLQPHIVALEVLIFAMEQHSNGKRTGDPVGTIGLFRFEEIVSEMRSSINAISKSSRGTSSFESWLAMDDAISCLEIVAKNLRSYQNSYYLGRSKKKKFIIPCSQSSNKKTDNTNRSRSRSRSSKKGRKSSHEKMEESKKDD